MPVPLDELLVQALATGDDSQLRARLTAHSGLPGARLNLRLVGEFGRAVAAVVGGPSPPGARLETLLDGWAALSVEAAPGDQPAVILPGAAMAAYGEVAAVRPDWWDDELAKLRGGARDPRWRVRELVAQALQRILDADWSRAMDELAGWSADDDPLVVRAAAAGVAEPRLLRDDARAVAAHDIQHRCVSRYRAYPAEQRHTEGAKVLRQALGFTVSVTVAATGDFALMEELAASGDGDLRSVAAENLKRARLQRWPERAARIRQLLD